MEEWALDPKFLWLHALNLSLHYTYSQEDLLLQTFFHPTNSLKVLFIVKFPSQLTTKVV